MKILRIIGLIFTKILLGISVMLFLISLSLNHVFADGVTSFFLNGFQNVNLNIHNREISSDEQINYEQFVVEGQSSNVDVNNMYVEILSQYGLTEEQVNLILDSPVAKKLISEFVGIVVEDFTSGNSEDFDIGEKALEFVEENQSELEEVIGEPLPMEKIEEFANSEEAEQINNQYKQMMTVANNSFSGPLRAIIKVMETFISTIFRTVCIGVAVILLIIIALLQWSFYKWIRTLGNTLWICGLFTIFIGFCMGLIVNNISKVFNIDELINFNSILRCNLIAVASGIILIVIYVFIKIIVKKRGDKNEISQNVN